MHFNIGAVLRVASVIVGTVVPAVGHVETIAQTFKAMSGKDKQNTVVDMVKTALSGAEGITGQDLLSDADVEAATRSLIDATVNLHNVVAKKHVGAGA